MKKKGLYVDGRFYDSIFKAAIDFEFSFSSFVKKLNSAEKFPMAYSGHEILLCEWLEKHPELIPNEK